MGFKNLLSVGLIGGMMVSGCGPEREIPEVQGPNFVDCADGQRYESGNLVLDRDSVGEAYFQLERGRSCNYQILLLDEGVLVSMIVTYQALGIEVTWMNENGGLVSSQPAMSNYQPEITKVSWAGISLESEATGIDQIMVRYRVDIPRLLKALGFTSELRLPDFGLLVKNTG